MRVTYATNTITAPFLPPPLSSVAGTEAWVGQINPVGSIQPSIALINAADTEGSAQLAPVFSTEETNKRTEEPIAIPDFGTAYQKTQLAYTGFEKADVLLWDRIRSETLSLAGTMHLNDGAEGHDGRAAVTLPRTPYRELIMGPIHPDHRNFENTTGIDQPLPRRNSGGYHSLLQLHVRPRLHG